MTKVVFKYTPLLTDVQDLIMPKGAEILSVQWQHEVLCIWALVDPEEASVPIKIRVVGTGHPIEDPEKWRFIDTVQMQGGALIWHFWQERIEYEDG